MNGDPLTACLQERITAAVAIARLLLEGAQPAEIRRRIATLPDAQPMRAELQSLAGSDLVLQRLRRMIDEAGVDHANATTPAAIAAVFDRAVAVSPEASVALHSLGKAERLQTATAEIVQWLLHEQLIGPNMDVLDFGCGIGRVAIAIGPHVRSVLGIDVSRGMLQEARRRNAGPANVSFALTDGHGLRCVADDSCDLVLAVDSFPYLVQAGVADACVADISRVLRDGGNLVVLNLSYRDMLERDRADAQDWCRRYGFSLSCSGCAPFRLWDGRAFVLTASPFRSAVC
jgi:ubiquinone/menaquinone biosynthesis C-methylase UbiE